MYIVHSVAVRVSFDISSDGDDYAVGWMITEGDE